VKNAEGTIDNCLISVRENNPAEIIVVDGLSSDRTVEVAREYTDRIYSDGGGGTSLAHQLGAELGTQQYIAYIDADIVLPPDSLATMLSELEASQYACIGAKILPASLDSYWERATQQHIAIIMSRNQMVPFSSVLLRRETVLKYRFDPFVSVAGDDADFMWMLKKVGLKLGLSSVLVWHHHRESLRTFIKPRFRNGRAKAWIAWKHGVLRPEFWPPLTTLYMLGFCLFKGKLNLWPYFTVVGLVESVAVTMGFVELFRRRLRGGNFPPIKWL